MSVKGNWGDEADAYVDDINPSEHMIDQGQLPTIGKDKKTALVKAESLAGHVIKVTARVVEKSAQGRKMNTNTADLDLFFRSRK